MTTLQLDVMLSRDATSAVNGKTVDMGEWDISKGFKRAVYVRNPYTFVKADVSNITNSDKRVKARFVSANSEPVKFIDPQETVRLDISIPPQDFDSTDDIQAFFNDVIDTLEGRIKWVKP